MNERDPQDDHRWGGPDGLRPARTPQTPKLTPTPAEHQPVHDLHDPGPEDELAGLLRTRLHAVVEDVAPTPDALARLRTAVPARRRRRRASVLAAVAAVAIVGVATPVVRNAVVTDDSAKGSVGSVSESPPADSGGPTADGNLNAGSSSNPAPVTGGGSGEGMSGVPGGGQKPPVAPPVPPTTGQGGQPGQGGHSTALPSGGVTTAPGTTPTTEPATPPTDPPPAAAPLCDAMDLTRSRGEVSEVGEDGNARGLVRIRNSGSADCRVVGPGVVIVANGPGNPPIQITVTMSQDSDLVGDTPPPSSTGAGVTVKPGYSYEFAFRWQPQRPAADGTCAAGGPQAGSPTLSYLLADGGLKVADVKLTPACGGTLSRTDIRLPDTRG